LRRAQSLLFDNPDLSDASELEEFNDRADERSVSTRQRHEILMRVLVIEDDAQLRAVMSIFLRSLGAEVLAEIPDGVAALEHLTAEDNDPPDLILTDCQMPRMDGISLVRHLRARGDQTPVIMISGQQDPRIVELAYAAGVDHYLPKPLTTDSLTMAIGQTFPNWAA
jgi:CheY-like chemotaxis protein